jgi:hypothetical protein
MLFLPGIQHVQERQHPAKSARFNPVLIYGIPEPINIA